ncbi:hypothetical protein [Allocoleopsis sp.]|uniref:hypothetical protein n=1 Tax=Allocoleopsis sp. TaxID=3088169 RepID=UPI002FD2A5CF
MPYHLQRIRSRRGTRSRFYVVSDRGLRMSKSPRSRVQALRQLRALYANVVDARRSR